jgi:hypothetical protein
MAYEKENVRIDSIMLSLGDIPDDPEDAESATHRGVLAANAQVYFDLIDGDDVIDTHKSVDVWPLLSDQQRQMVLSLHEILVAVLA